jgi:plasmid maintenance system antidote protein VapI
VPKAGGDADRSVAHGVIDSSLFESANAAGLSDAGVLKLAKIFGSDIDFVLGLRRAMTSRWRTSASARTASTSRTARSWQRAS